MLIQRSVSVAIFLFGGRYPAIRILEERIGDPCGFLLFI
jgi:hypothetical protein